MRMTLGRLLIPSLVSAIGLAGCQAFFLGRPGTSVASVAITPANPTLTVGQTQQFVANVTFTDGITIQAAQNTVAWSSSDTAVATIDSFGTATAASVGTATITGSYFNVSGSTTVTVVAATQVGVQISGSATRLEASFGDSGQRFVYVADSAENVIEVYGSSAAAREEQRLDSIPVDPARGPAWLAIDPSGKFLYVANHASGNISVFSIDQASGQLTPVAGSPFDAGVAPWSVAVDSDGQSLSITHFGSNDVSRLRIDRSTGAISP